jgi:putative pyoverdin transport system ATP-binding/permease protein
VSILDNLHKILSFLMEHTRERRYSRVGLVLAIVVGMIGGLSNTALVAVMNAVISRNGAVSKGLLWSFIALCFLTPLSRLICSILLSYLNTQATFEIGIGLCHRILGAPLRQLEQIGAARLYATIGDMGTIAIAVTSLPGLAMNLAIVIGCLIYMGWLSGTLLTGVIMILLLGVSINYIPLIKARHRFEMARDKSDLWTKHFRAVVEGSKELRLNARRREAFYLNHLHPTAVEITRFNHLGTVFIAVSSSVTQLMTFIPIGLLIFAASMLSGARSGIVTGYILAIIYMIGPLMGIISLFQSLSMASASVNKIKSLSLPLAKALPLGHKRQEKPASSQNQIVLSGVTHTYFIEEKEQDFTLGPINLEFNTGELVFVAGGNGSGKTTLAKLITGLYVPEKGDIFFNGALVTDENRESYRQNFSMIFSDFFLFESLLSLEQVPDLSGRVGEYLALLQLDHKVKVRGGEITTINLSQGQRRRLALLTAYLEDRPIYIFDEWASDQDPLFRDIFYRRLLPDLKSRGKIVIVISHDDRYYEIGDRIIKLDYGLVEYDKSVARSLKAVESTRE